MTRKKNNNRARALRFTRALLRQHGVVVVHYEIAGKVAQGLMSHKDCRSVAAGRQLADGITKLPHHWTIYLAAFCVDQSGQRYTKAVEIAPTAAYISDDLAEAMETHHAELISSCNPAHYRGGGWIASPVGHSLTEADADRIFSSAAVWDILKEQEQEK